jgi:hypothetical protein
MFYSFTNVPKVPNLDFSKCNITDSTNFSQMMEANSKREEVVGLIASISQNANALVDDSKLKSAIGNLSASIDLVR